MVDGDERPEHASVHLGVEDGDPNAIAGQQVGVRARESSDQTLPFEIESVLLEHPAVTEVAVVGTPDPIRGMAIKAFIVVAQGYTASDPLAAELLAYSRAQTAASKCPHEIEFMTDLPKTITGKLRRVELCECEPARKARV
jgi:acyl-coenzyme A synthetase/AMP-(fatty) acid ligase